MKVSAAIDEYLSTRKNSLAQKTYEWYALFLNAFEKWCKQERIGDLSQITALVVQKFVADCPTANTNTRHHRAQVIKSFLNWCVKDEDMGVQEKVVKRIEMPKRRQPDVKIFTPDEINRLMSACEETQQPLRNKAILHTLLDTGARAAELCFDNSRTDEETGLRLEHIVLGKDGESYIWVMGKGSKPREIGIGYQTSLSIRRYIDRERGLSICPFVFLERSGNDPLSIRMLQQLLKALGETARVDDCHPHRFRHTFAVNQLMNGTSSLVLMQLMGHTTLESTKIYIRAMSQVQARKASTSVVDTMTNRQKPVRLWKTDVEEKWAQMARQTENSSPLLSWRSGAEEKRIDLEYNLLKKEEEHEKRMANRDPRVIPAWMREEIWKRDDGACKQCGSKRRLEYDHVIPWSLGGATSIDNLQILCHSCHQGKTAGID